MLSLLKKRAQKTPGGRGKRAPARADSPKRAAPTRRTKPNNRVPVQGATRKGQAQKKPRQPSVWFNRVLILFAAVVVVAAGTKAYLVLDQLPVQRITVTGQLEHTQAEAVQDMVQASLAGGFLSADLQRMRAQLEGLPWIFEATVRRRWPSALEIHVVEQLPIARWGADSFLNHEGGVFESDSVVEWESLPQLRGPEGSAPALMAKYLRLVEILAPLNLTVRELSVDGRSQVEAVLGDGVLLLLGSTDFRERMQRFVSVYRRELAARAGQIERVDLRYTSGLAVAFAEVEQAQDSQVAGL